MVVVVPMAVPMAMAVVVVVTVLSVFAIAVFLVYMCTVGIVACRRRAGKPENHCCGGSDEISALRARRTMVVVVPAVVVPAVVMLMVVMFVVVVPAECTRVPATC